MLLAIDVGNTHTVYGLWDGDWRAVFRLGTDPDETEDELAAALRGLFELSGLPFRVDAAICASVVPGVNDALSKLCDRWLGVPLRFLRTGEEVGLPVRYEPPTGVGADRIANALAALARFAPPIVVVDFGTATTFDVVDAEGVYVGGAILPGLILSGQALSGKTAKLPQVELVAPSRAVGRNTSESMQSGLMFGYAGAIDGIARRIRSEVGEGARVIATGGLGARFTGLCETLESYEPTLTLEGLLIAHRRLTSPPATA